LIRIVCEKNVVLVNGQVVVSLPQIVDCCTIFSKWGSEWYVSLCPFKSFYFNSNSGNFDSLKRCYIAGLCCLIQIMCVLAEMYKMYVF